jgi:hypothetical protein
VHSLLWTPNSYSAQEIHWSNGTPKYPLPSDSWGFHGSEDDDCILIHSNPVHTFTHTMYPRYKLMLIFNLCILPSNLLPQGLQTKILYAILVLPSVTCLPPPSTFFTTLYQGWPTRPVLEAPIYEATIGRSHEGHELQYLENLSHLL